MFSDMHEEWEYRLVEKTKKETAREILKWILETFGDLWAKIDEVYDICNYISRQYGVEIGEHETLYNE